MKYWKTTLALILMAFAIYYQWNWFWALIIVLGLINVIITGEIHFVENIKRTESQSMYWIMVMVWSFFSLITILDYFR